MRGGRATSRRRRGRRRGLRRVPPHRHAERARAAAAHRNLVVTRTMSKAFALAGARLGYLAAAPGDLRRAPRGAAALPPVGGHPGGRAGGAAPRRRAARPGRRRCAPSGTRTVDLAARAGARRSPTRDANFVLFGAFADRHAVWQGLLDRGRADPRGRPRRLAAGVDRHARGDGGVQGGPDWTRARREGAPDEPHRDGSSGRPRSPRSSSRSTSTAPAATDISTGVGVLRPHAHRVRQALAARPDRPDRRRHPHRRPPHGRGHRDRARPGAARGAGRQGRHPPLRRRHRAAGRGARPGRRRRVRPPLLRAHRRAGRARSTSLDRRRTTPAR